MITRRLFIASSLQATLPAAERIGISTGGEVRFAIHSDPKTFDPLQVTEEIGESIRYLTSGSLVRVNRRTLRPELELAESWKVNGTGRRVTIELRRGISFSDGTPFDAEDVAYTLGRLLDPQKPVPAGDALRALAGSIRSQVSGRHTAVLDFTNPVAAPERVLGFPILSSRSPLKEKTVLGIFQIDDYKPGSYVRLRRNPNYWKKDASGRRLPYVDALRLEVTQNRDLELVRLSRGELHFVSTVSPESFDRLRREQPESARDAGPSLDFEMAWFNLAPQAPIAAHKKEWFGNRNFRRAISDAINRADLVHMVYRGYAVPAAGCVSPANPRWAHPKLKPPVCDPAAAIRRLASDGFRLENGRLKDRAGHPVEFSVITNASSKTRSRMASLIQQDLSRIGVQLQVVTLDFPSLVERISRTLHYEFCLLGLTNVDADPNGLANMWPSSGSQHAWNPNQAKPATPWEAEIDRLMLEQGTAMQPAGRKAAFDRVQEIAWEHAPILFLLHPHALCAVSGALRNASPVAVHPRVFWNAEHLWLERT
jgi:peptide/nickel transport system substrate-binding protein